MIYYNQYDYPNVPYPAKGYETATIKSSGCGVCCASIIVETLTGQKFPPPDSAKFSIASGARVSGGTDMNVLAKTLARKFGLVFTTSSKLSDLTECLKSGGMAIANTGGNRGNYKGVFSNGGHYIVVAKVNGSTLTILDPGMYSGKYSAAHRKVIKVTGNELTASVSVLDKDCDNRSPRYYLFTMPPQKTILDISENQTVDWRKLKTDGVIIRAGYRGYETGKLNHDKKFMEHIQGAYGAGIPIGIYFCSQAISGKEAVEEAQYVSDLIHGYPITLPVYLDSENMSPKATGRGDMLTKAQRTQYGLTFCRAIKDAGYIPGLYCSESWYTARLDGSAFDKAGYHIWIANYTEKPKVRHDAWQYTETGRVDGVGTVDMSHFYKEEEVQTTTITAKMNGKPVKLTSILYENENYIRIRDLADAQPDDKLTVDWDAATKTVIINSK